MDKKERELARGILKYNMDIIVNNIYRLLEERKMNQRKLAELIWSDPPHLNYILKNQSGITINVLGRIAKALDTTISELAKK